MAIKVRSAAITTNKTAAIVRGRRPAWQANLLTGALSWAKTLPRFLLRMLLER